MLEFIEPTKNTPEPNYWDDCFRMLDSSDKVHAISKKFHIYCHTKDRHRWYIVANSSKSYRYVYAGIKVEYFNSEDIKYSSPHDEKLAIVEDVIPFTQLNSEEYTAKIFDYLIEISRIHVQSRLKYSKRIDSLFYQTLPKYDINPKLYDTVIFKVYNHTDLPEGFRNDVEDRYIWGIDRNDNYISQPRELLMRAPTPWVVK